ncbi:MAG: glycine--tRNA ligase [Planctomycetota bacterium]|nr:glycine--tRNA ligase [Planctomycetota bacterium]
MPDLMERVVALTKRRGFIFPSSEIYGGLQATYDYGPAGVELKRLIKDDWWRDMVREREDVVGLDASILMAARVWEVSGHVAGFNDPMVDCKTCKGRFREDKLAGSQCLKKKKMTPLECGGELTEPRLFNLMFKTKAGPIDDDAATVYLRPETAQGIFVNFKNVMDSTRVKIPFGVAQIGKAFRNEIVTGGQIFRMREFEQMEMEFFCAPGTDEEWHEYWKAERLRWWQELGVRKEKLRIRDHEKDELAHYARGCGDIEYEYPWGWDEVEGVANRTDYDLGHHQEGSGRGLAYRDDEKKEWVVPYVIEPSGGVDRCFLTVLCDAYEEEEKPNGEVRTVLHLHPRLAPTQVGVFPLVKKDGMPEKARAIYDDLKLRFRATYDQAGSIGKRYARLDEVGTPFCVTVDGDTATDGTVTVRHRDSLAQDRVPAENVAAFLGDAMASWTRE